MTLWTFRRFAVLCLLLAGASAPALGQTQNPPKSAPAPATPSFDEIANVVVAGLQSGNYDELVPYWSQGAMTRLPPSRVRGLWEAVSSTLGPVIEVLPAETIVMDGGRTFSKVPIRFDSVLITVTVLFDAASRVDGVSIQRAAG